MQIFFIIALCLAVAGRYGECAPASQLHGGSSLLTRDDDGVIDVIVEAAEGLATLIEQIVDFFTDTVDDIQHDQESDWTQAMVANLTAQYPTSNVLVYHDTDSQYSFNGASHYHYELPLFGGVQTQGYEVWVFDSGSFTLAGDGGFLNWCFDGSYTRDENSVTFNTISSDAPPPPPRPPQPVPPPNPVRMSPDQTDGNYFVNCLLQDDSDTQTWSSGLAYYRNLNPGQNVGQQPDGYVDVLHGSLVDWTQTTSVTFPSTGTTVTWSIFGDWETQGINTTAGTSSNGYESFWVYIDADTWLYSVDDWECQSVFFSF